MADSKHAKLSPSGSSRWMECPASVVLEEGEPNGDNEYSKEGTLAHALAAHCLEKKLDAGKVLVLDVSDKKGGVKHETISTEMAEYVQEYLDHVREEAVGGYLMIEQGLDLSEITGEEGAEGTADTVILKDDTLKIIDLKYGFHEVEAYNNSQLRIYGLCASDVFSALGDFAKYELGIFQPRIRNIDSETVTAEEMKIFADKVKAAVKSVEEARKSNSLDGFLKAGSHCRWCRAAYKCPKIAQAVVEETMVDFDDETQTELVEPVDLAKAGAKLELLEGWIKSVRRKIEAELFSGTKIKGWKLVQGKQGNREFIDENETKEKLKKAGIPESTITKTVVLSVAQLEKKLKGNKKALDLLPTLYGRTPGKVGVAPVSDPRPSYTVKPEDDFSDVE